jgi:hypothetical protein
LVTPICCGIELDPLYVDVIIRRYEAETGIAAILAESGETFEKVVARRRNEESDDIFTGSLKAPCQAVCAENQAFV